MSKRIWTMPRWMERYRESIVNTGGLSIEDIMTRDPREANVVINAPVALICVAVQSQIALLERLKHDGRLPR
jgi:hypothetical protein